MLRQFNSEEQLRVRVMEGKGHKFLLLVLMLTTTSSARISSWDDRYECYVEKGRGLRLRYPSKLETVSSLRECEQACDRASFECKSFSYSEYQSREPRNCLLSREDSHILNIHDQRDFYNDADFIYYERGSGRDCDYGGGSNNNRGGCYRLVNTGMRMDRRYIIFGKVLRTRDRRECEEECDRARECRGFNFRYKTLGYNQYRDNCELSSRERATTSDLVRDEDFDYYERDYESKDCYSGGGGGGSGGGSGRDECFRLVEKEARIDGRIVRDSYDVHNIRECEQVCERARSYVCKSFSFSYDGGSYQYKNCILSDQEYRDLSSYYLVRDRGADVYERRLYDRECGADTGTNGQYPYGEGEATVNGLRCYRGICQESQQGGYYYCYTDNSDAWDYCCRPHERCGFSEGSRLAWCYVGTVGRDQWRPCTTQGRTRAYLKENPPLVNLSRPVELLDLNP